jgi:3-methylfumaryl-CoA hydratase
MRASTKRGGAVKNLERAREWLGRVDVREDVAAPSALVTLYDLIGACERPPDIGAELPPLAHWLYFSSWTRLADTRENGEYRDPMLPPIELPRRICAQCHIVRHRPIYVGDPISRILRIVDLAEAQGQAGPVVTLLLRCEIHDSEGPALSETRRLVYMNNSEPWPSSQAPRPLAPAQWRRDYNASSRSLFGYAALTHDMSRVHYDRPFAVFVERHQGLVVPSEFVCALLLDLAAARAGGARVARVAFNNRGWIYDTAPVRLRACWSAPAEITVWAEDSSGRLAVDGLVTLESDFARAS